MRGSEYGRSSSSTLPMLGLNGGRGGYRQGNAHNARLTGFARKDFQLAVMGFVDFADDRQPQSQSHVARGVEWRGRFLRSLSGETGAVILHFNLQIMHRSR